MTRHVISTLLLWLVFCSNASAQLAPGDCRTVRDFRDDLAGYVGLLSGDRVIPITHDGRRRAEQQGRAGVTNQEEMESLLAIAQRPEESNEYKLLPDDQKSGYVNYVRNMLYLGLQVNQSKADRVALFYNSALKTTLVIAREMIIRDDTSAPTISDRMCIEDVIRPATVLDFRSGTSVSQIWQRASENPDLSFCDSDAARLTFRSCASRETQLRTLERKGMRPVVYGDIAAGGRSPGIYLGVINSDAAALSFYSISPDGLMGEHFSLRQVTLGRNFRRELGMPE